MFYRYTRCRLQMIIGPRPYSVYSGCRVRGLAYTGGENGSCSPSCKCPGVLITGGGPENGKGSRSVLLGSPGTSLAYQKKPLSLGGGQGVTGMEQQATGYLDHRPPLLIGR